MLAIEYDVTSEGQIEVVALINAIDEEGDDPSGDAWLAWRQSLEDEGMGCVAVTPEELARMEATDDPDEFKAIVENLILNDRRGKEEA